MPTNEPTRQERIDAIPRSARVLGIDAAGRAHLYDLPRLEIWVVDGIDTRSPECVHYEHVPDRSLVEWMLFVDDQCGWSVRHHVEKDAFEGLFDTEQTPPTRREVLAND